MDYLPDYVIVEIDSYNEDLSWNVKQSGMDNGDVKQMKGRSKPVRDRNVKLVLQSDKCKRQFEEWLDSIGGGTQVFIYKDPVNFGEKRCRFINTSWKFTLDNSQDWVVDCVIRSVW